MRKIVNVCGVSGKRTSKKGWEYYTIAFIYEDEKLHGFRAVTVNVGVDIMGKIVPSAGDELEFVFHEYNFQTYVDAILSPD